MVLTIKNDETFLPDDAFSNWNWAGACRGRRVGPGLLADWDAGFLNCLG